ncbi:MAG TPA: hypothetical protein VGO74_13415 [Modestobacter sp.]|nr:hypothetical protein [Modestobacter sp.]
MVLDGVAERVLANAALRTFLDALNEEYAAGLAPDVVDPDVTATFAVRPERVIALTGADFPGSPTRWRFPPP